MPSDESKRFASILRDLADEAERLNYIGGGFIFFGGHQYTVGIGYERDGDDPFEMTRNVAFRLECDVNSQAFQRGQPHGPDAHHRIQ